MTAPDDKTPLRPIEAAKVTGVAPETLRRWAREGRLPFSTTVGGHRRYRLSDIRALMNDAGKTDRELADEAAQLYEQGLGIRAVGNKIGFGYLKTRRLLMLRTTLRGPGGQTLPPLSDRLAGASAQLTRTAASALATDNEPDGLGSLTSYLHAISEHGHTLASLALDYVEAAKADEAAEWGDIELSLAHAAALFDAAGSFIGDAYRCVEGLDSQHLTTSGAPANDSCGGDVTPPPLPPAGMAAHTDE